MGWVWPKFAGFVEKDLGKKQHRGTREGRGSPWDIKEPCGPRGGTMKFHMKEMAQMKNLSKYFGIMDGRRPNRNY